MSDTTGTPRQIMDGPAPKAEPAKLLIEMSFLDHLEELRWRILKGLSGVAVGVVIAFIFSDFFIAEVLLGPAKADFFIYTFFGVDAVDLVLQNRTLPGQFFSYMGTLFVVGLIIGSPIFFFQLWSFIEPALEQGEKKNSTLVVTAITGMFIVGLLFGYMILTPFALQFFAQFQIAETVRNDFDINSYFSSLTLWTLTCGIIFQLPFVAHSLTKIGLITPDFMIKYRRVAIVVCFLAAAILTPPDPVSQFMVAVPLLILYQVGIVISRITYKKRQKEIWGKQGNPDKK